MTAQNQTLRKSEVFLYLAERLSGGASDASAAADGSGGEVSTLPDFAAAVSEQMPPDVAEEFGLLGSEFQSRTPEENDEWLRRVESLIGADEPVLDENIHWSHVSARLERETPEARKILFAALPPAHQNLFLQEGFEAETRVGISKPQCLPALQKSIRRAFAGQFVALSDLPAPGSFDRLDGAGLARLVRLAGIREVALACAGIETVETVAAFLRRFEPEDARAVAAQLSGLREVRGERLAFAEGLVQQALELEPNPSAMLDILGLRLIGILLCDGDPAAHAGAARRIVYAEQKLPLGVAPRLSEIIETQCRQTPAARLGEISAEVEALAGTILETGGRGRRAE